MYAISMLNAFVWRRTDIDSLMYTCGTYKKIINLRIKIVAQLLDRRTLIASIN